MLTGLNRCGRYRSRRRGSRERFARWESRRFMTGDANRRFANRLEPICEPVFDEANFGYRRGRSTKDAMRKVWKEIQSGREWIVDADLKDFFGSGDHEKMFTLGAPRIDDGRGV